MGKIKDINRVKVDAAKLREAVKKSGGSAADMARAIGRSEGFISKYTRDIPQLLYIGKGDALLIEKLYGIDIVDHTPTLTESGEAINKSKDIAKELPKVFDEAFFKDLKDAIYFGIKDAMTEVFREKEGITS